jgi:hypothetical protein
MTTAAVVVPVAGGVEAEVEREEEKARLLRPPGEVRVSVVAQHDAPTKTTTTMRMKIASCATLTDLGTVAVVEVVGAGGWEKEEEKVWEK